MVSERRLAGRLTVELSLDAGVRGRGAALDPDARGHHGRDGGGARLEVLLGSPLLHVLRRNGTENRGPS